MFFTEGRTGKAYMKMQFGKGGGRGPDAKKSYEYKLEGGPTSAAIDCRPPFPHRGLRFGRPCGSPSTISTEYPIQRAGSVRVPPPPPVHRPSTVSRLQPTGKGKQTSGEAASRSTKSGGNSQEAKSKADPPPRPRPAIAPYW